MAYMECLGFNTIAITPIFPLVGFSDIKTSGEKTRSEGGFGPQAPGVQLEGVQF